MAKWVYNPVKKIPVRVSDDEAAKAVKMPGWKYLSKNEARRLQATLEKVQ